MVAVSVSLLAGCASSTGVSAVAEDPGFEQCLVGVGVELDDELTEPQELSLWREPGALSCAATELDDDQLDEALGRSFANPADSDDLQATAQAQQAAVRQLATDRAREGGADDAAASVKRVLDTRDTDDFSFVLARVAAAGLVEGEQGELPGYDAFLRRTGSADRPAALTEYLQEIVEEDRQPIGDRLEALRERLSDT